MSQRVKFALWNFARLHPLPGAVIRAAGRIAMGDAEKALRNRLAGAPGSFLPADRYGRDLDVPTQVWLLDGQADGLERAGVRMLLNHLSIPYRVGKPDAKIAGAAAVFVINASWSEVQKLRAYAAADTLIVCFLEGVLPASVEGIAVCGPASRLLPHRDGLRSDFAASVVRALRDQLRIPVVTGKLAPLVGLRIDDVEGDGLATWLAVIREHGWRPNLGLFINSFSKGDNPAGRIIADSCRTAEADASPHAFDPATFLLFDYPWGRPFSRDEFDQRWCRAKACFEDYGIPLSPIVNAHFHVLSRSAAERLAAEGARFFYSELAIDTASAIPGQDNWPTGSPTMCTFRPDPSGVVQLSCGDHILDVMSERSHYDFMMHGGADNPAMAARRIGRRLSLSLDCGFPAYVTTHEYFFRTWPGPAPHRALWATVDEALTGTGWGAGSKGLVGGDRGRRRGGPEHSHFCGRVGRERYARGHPPRWRGRRADRNRPRTRS